MHGVLIFQEQIPLCLYLVVMTVRYSKTFILKFSCQFPWYATVISEYFCNENHMQHTSLNHYLDKFHILLYNPNHIY